MVNVSIARRYARALLDVAGAQADEVLQQLEALTASVQSSSELNDLLSNPAYNREQRAKVMTAVLAAVKVTAPALVKTVSLLNDRNRLGSLQDIARLYRTLVDQRVGRVRGTVTSAVALSDAQLKGLELGLEKVTQRDVVLEAKVDPALLGGLTAQVGGTIYDGSLKSQLQSIQRELSR